MDATHLAKNLFAFYMYASKLEFYIGTRKFVYLYISSIY
ncbi:MAG: rhomboid family intramembrane serine protease, partial [Symploca sp. SIO1A3]|nr:rhomboid family intramembrane serine protease [Symploca sp. SIO1A3]